MQSWQAGAAPGDNDTTFVPVPPCRLFDTRPGLDNVGIRVAPLGPGETFPTQVTAATASASASPPTPPPLHSTSPPSARRPSRTSHSSRRTSPRRPRRRTSTGSQDSHPHPTRSTSNCHPTAKSRSLTISGPSTSSPMSSATTHHRASPRSSRVCSLWKPTRRSRCRHPPQVKSRSRPRGRRS